MAEEFKYTLTFESLSTGTGAKQAAEGVDAVAVATDKLNRKQTDLRAEFSAISNRADASRAAYYDLGAEIDRTRTKQDKIPEANGKVAASSRNASMALLDFSRGFEDLQYGIRGVLNNIPSLVMNMGGTAGLAGGISIAAVALSQIIPLFDSMGESAKVSDEKVKELATRIGNLKEASLAKTREEINKTTERAKALQQDWAETKKAEAEYKEASITNSESIRAAQEKVNRLLGERINRLREIEGIEAAAAATRKAQEENAIAAQEDRLAKIGNDIAIQSGAVARLKADLDKTVSELNETLQKKRDLEAQITETKNTAGAEIQPYNMGPGPASNKIDFAARESAKTNIPSLEMRLQALTAEVEALRNERKIATEGLRVQKNSLTGLEKQSEDITSAVATKIENIKQTYEAADLKGQAAALEVQSKALIEQANESFAKVQSTSEDVKAAQESLKEAFKDLQVVPAENRQVAEAMRTIVTAVQTGQASTTETIATLTNNQSLFLAKMQQIQMTAENIKNQLSDLSRK